MMGVDELLFILIVTLIVLIIRVFMKEFNKWRDEE